MPLAESWVEELVAEYFILRGYMIYVDYPIGTGKGGGRKDIDVVAIDPSRKQIYLIDIKSIWVASSEDLATDITARLEEAKKVISSAYGDDYEYLKVSILVGDPNRPKTRRIINRLKREGIEAKDLSSLIKDIANYIDTWREQQIAKGIVSPNTEATIPSTLYLIKLLEYLKDYELLNE